MERHTQCIECGGLAQVSSPDETTRVEECGECGRRSHWRVCTDCGEVNGPRRVICLECGLPFDRKEALISARLHTKNRARPVRALSH